MHPCSRSLGNQSHILPRLKTKAALLWVVDGDEQGRVISHLKAHTTAVDEILPDGVAPFGLTLKKNRLSSKPIAPGDFKFEC